MNTEQQPTFQDCIKNLSCSPLLYLNIQRFLKKKELYEDEKDAYKQICKEFYIHQDENVREYMAKTMGDKLFNGRVVFESKPPYIARNHSVFLDFCTESEPVAPVTFKKFKEAMKKTIYPFKDGNMENSDSKERCLFLLVLANSFIYGLDLYYRESKIKFETIINDLGLSEMIGKLPRGYSWFYTHFKDVEKSSLKKEWNVTDAILNSIKSSNVDFMRYFFILYLWNRISLVVEAFLPTINAFERKQLYPNFVWTIIERNEKIPPQRYTKLMKDVENELLEKWSSYWKDELVVHKRLLRCYVDSSFKFFSEDLYSVIPDSLRTNVIDPFSVKWERFLFKQTSKSQASRYIGKIKSAIKRIQRKERYAFAYAPKAFIFDDIQKINTNPFLEFQVHAKDNLLEDAKPGEQILSSDDTLSMDNICYSDNYRMICPLQVLQLPLDTQNDLFAKVDNLEKAFYAYLRAHMRIIPKLKEVKKEKKKDKKMPLTKEEKDKELDRKRKERARKLNNELYCKLEQEGFRLISNSVTPLHRTDFHIWKPFLSDFINKNILGNSYLPFDAILAISDNINDKFSEKKTELDFFFQPIASYNDTKQKTNKELLLAFIEKRYKISEMDKDHLDDYQIERRCAHKCFEILNDIEKGDDFFNNITDKDNMKKYCIKEINSRHLKVILLFWWICGYIEYIRKGIILRKEEKYVKSPNGAHKRIKRIGLTRLSGFQEQTCKYSIIFRRLDKADSAVFDSREVDRKTDREKIIGLYLSLSLADHIMDYYICNSEQSEKCCNIIQGISRKILDGQENYIQDEAD